MYEYAIHRVEQWCIAKNGGGYTQTGVAKGLKVPCLFMIAEVSIRCQKNPGGWYTPYACVYPPIHHWTGLSVEESVGMTEDRDKWRKYVHGVANPRNEDG